ncbi:MAG: hypothetical protein ACXW1W_12815 [Methylococcaceae bacterium]
MKKTTIVALLILFSAQCVAGNLKDSLSEIENEWANIYYNVAKQKQAPAYHRLLDKTIALSKQYPNEADALFWQAVIKSAYAEHQDPVSALSAVYEARDLLLKGIAINPKAMDGSLYVTLGTLYYMVPKWPIAFGDDAVAKKMLETALKINPNGIDSNYFYGDFLLSNDNLKEAETYFERAVAVPSRVEQLYADNQLKEEAKMALKKTREQKGNSSKSTLSLFNSSDVK